MAGGQGHPARADRVLASFIDEARRAPAIERVLLFGSRARGDAGERSDYDLAVAAPTMSALERAAFAGRWNEHKPTLLATDIVWLDEVTDSELAEHIRDEGIVLYVR